MPKLLSELEKIIVIEQCLNLGIVPIVDNDHLDVNKILANTDPVQARKFKRKFRKLWRKFAKKDVRETKETWLKATVGLQPGIKPKKHHKRSRKKVVIHHIWETNVKPALAQINSTLEKNPLTDNEQT